uniref:Ubiquitin carboxyl-terminal hydrolase n=1 Tax=Rhizophora mucronata TaxID=61149 RepID=A0A2P2MZF8_RHIMU
MVRGLVNLGNTCFFNSVLQNLLAMDRLRDYFLNDDACFGPLSLSLKKLFVETRPETGLKNVINPRTFFGSVCSKAPQFRGSQQQDSHELLRCLLDGLSTEELVSWKQMNTSEENGVSPKLGSTFVDAAFGGQISSTVCCVECGHSSTVYESFLDLSLSVPTKKPPTKKPPPKNFQPLYVPKKTKMLPKRGGRVQQKVSKDRATDPANLSAIGEPLCQTQSCMPVVENKVPSLHEAALPDSIDSRSSADESGSVSQNFSATVESGSEQVVEARMEETEASFGHSWMDYLGTETVADEHGNDISVSDSIGGLVPGNDLTGTSQAYSIDGEPNQNFDSSVNPWEDKVPLQVQSSEVLLLPYKEESSPDREIMGEEAEASSSVVGCGQGEADFDGFGDLFNEPEASAVPVVGPSLGSEVVETSLTEGNVSESDPEEVDNADSPVSVESCLAHFIKPELLSNDNAWECESCSKALQRQRSVFKKKQAKSASEMWINGGETAIQSPPRLDNDLQFSEVGNHNNGDASTGTDVNSIGESIVSSNGKIDHSNQDYITTTSGQMDGDLSISQDKEQKGRKSLTTPEQSHSDYNESQEIFSGQPVGSCSIGNSSSVGHANAKDQQNNSLVLGICEPEEKQDEDKFCKTVNVKRDATKRVFINKAPPILTIHLKRFSQDARGRLNKLNGHINFRDTLDLGPYMDPRCPNVDKHIFRLLGVVEHLGAMRGGHYVAYVRGSRPGKQNGGSVWYHVSDAYVREVSLEEVLRREAYILFYEKI